MGHAHFGAVGDVLFSFSFGMMMPRAPCTPEGAFVTVSAFRSFDFDAFVSVSSSV
jgi:hypothetical protein